MNPLRRNFNAINVNISMQCSFQLVQMFLCALLQEVPDDKIDRHLTERGAKMI